jgi:hypothetical protein
MSRTWIATLAAIWLLDIGSAAYLIRVVDRQRANEVPGAPPLTAEVFFAPEETQQPVVNATETPFLQMPEVTIVAAPPGVAEMQGTDDLVIGPGTVTHPVAKPPSPPRPR